MSSRAETLLVPVGATESGRVHFGCVGTNLDLAGVLEPNPSQDYVNHHHWPYRPSAVRAQP